jgi:hypothetical protein
MCHRCPVEFMILYREFGGNLWIRQEILIYNLTFFAQQVEYVTVSFSDDEFVIGPCRSTATHDNDRK